MGNLKLYNTLSRQIEEFKPLKPPRVTLYTCGPTVYDYPHIGNLRKYVIDDLLKTTLVANNFEVKHVENITDVGHLVSDEDTGEDKMEKGAKESGRSVWEVAKFFEAEFWEASDALNIQRPDIVAKATEHINKQIKLIEILEKKGFSYITSEAIYFDTAKFPGYIKLSGQKLEEEKVGAREDVVVDKQKRQPQDFALWFFTVGHFSSHVMRWSSPWGEGFPGWHIECSAMSMEYLGETLDIHTGGIDHIKIHHTNEIAQSEAATGKKFVRFWLHTNFLLVEGGKMSKSKKNFYTLTDIINRGFDPLALRYLFLTAHYREQLNFTWESLTAAQTTLNKLRSEIRLWEQPKGNTSEFWQQFLDSANSDLNIPQAVGVLHKMLASTHTTSSKAVDLLAMDKILRLKLDKYLSQPLEIPERIENLRKKIDETRLEGNYRTADEYRKEIQKQGFIVQNTTAGTVVTASETKQSS